MKKMNTILKTNDIIKLIKQDKSLYGRGLEHLSNQALGKVIKDKFKAFDIACDMDKVRVELAKDPPSTRDSVLLYNAIVLLLERRTKGEIAEEIGCTVAKINKILEGK